jgi:predicted ATP-grasp superfamily ATP-dependent carboligase
LRSEAINLSTVLITNGLLSKSLAVVRSLGSRGIRTLAAEKMRWHTSGFSKYCSKSIRCPDPVRQPENYWNWLKSTLVKEQCDVLFVMDDDTTKIAIQHREELEAICRIVLPTNDHYAIAADKGRTMHTANEIGIPCPRTLQWEDGAPTAEELIRLTSTLQYPLVIKPRESSGSRGIRIANNQEELIPLFFYVHDKYPNPLVQEKIPQGPKYDVCLCYDDKHQLQASFVQKEIRHYPLESGPSTVHESVLYPELLAYSKRLMDELNWYGVADIEFMIDPRSGEPKLMEINPRFWSSTHLAIHSGIDFPWILYQIAMNETFEPQHDYIIGKRGRALMPGDLLHFITNPNRMQMDPPIWTTKYPDDIISKKDPMPTFGFLLSAISIGWKLETWNFIIRR